MKLQDREKIKQWLENHLIFKYEINDDLTIDVDASVYLFDEGLSEIPVSFRSVKGDFNCANNHLTSLEGAPIFVGKSFDCSQNKLRSLKYAPQTIGADFYCSSNMIKSLEFGPSNINRSAYYHGNCIENLLFIPQRIGEEVNLEMNRLLEEAQKIKTFKEMQEEHWRQTVKRQKENLESFLPLKEGTKKLKL